MKIKNMLNEISNTNLIRGEMVEWTANWTNGATPPKPVQIHFTGKIKKVLANNIEVEIHTPAAHSGIVVTVPKDKFEKIKMDRMDESIHDKIQNKAVFVIGLPGAGKTYLSNKIFGFQNNISIYNAKEVNPDRYFEYKTRHKKTVDWNKDKDKLSKLFMKSRDIRDENLEYYSKEKLPLIINGTGRDPKSLIWEAERLKDRGYSVYMIVVNTSLDKSIEQNSLRKRKVEVSLIYNVYNALKDAIPIYKKFFGSNFFVVNANNKEKELLALGRKIMLGK